MSRNPERQDVAERRGDRHGRDGEGHERRDRERTGARLPAVRQRRSPGRAPGVDVRLVRHVAAKPAMTPTVTRPDSVNGPYRTQSGSSATSRVSGSGAGASAVASATGRRRVAAMQELLPQPGGLGSA